MPRATICVAVDCEQEVRAAKAWFAKWKDDLEFISENQGCGCCVNIWDVQGAAEAIAEIPESITANSDWTNHEE